MVDDSSQRWPWSELPVCLVTGAAHGLGRAVAEAFAASGATVVVTSRDGESASRAACEISPLGGSALGMRLDITAPAEVAHVARRLEAEYGRVDVLINNAAAYVDWSELASTADLDASRKVMEANLYGTWNVTASCLPLLRRGEHPRIVNLASGAGSHGDRQYGLSARRGAAASYGVSKAALLALTSTLAAEFADSPVIINAVDPDLTATWPGAEGMGARPVRDSVGGVMWAATLLDDGPRGGFFRDGQPHPW